MSECMCVVMVWCVFSSYEHSGPAFIPDTTSPPLPSSPLAPHHARPAPCVSLRLVKARAVLVARCMRTTQHTTQHAERSKEMMVRDEDGEASTMTWSTSI